MMGQIYFSWDEMKWKGIKVADAMRWEELFPDVDVMNELTVNMPIWLEKNQNRKQSHKKNWTKFILNWLKRSEERRIGK